MTRVARWQSARASRPAAPTGRKHRVQGHHQGLFQLLGQRHHEGAGVAAEDPVLVLDQHNVGASEGEVGGHRRVVAADILADRCHNLRLGNRSRIPHDGDDLYRTQRVGLDQGVPQVMGEHRFDP